MSLLIFGAGSKIGQGIVRKFYQSGNFKNIVCADLFPSYEHLKDFYTFRENLDQTPSDVKLREIKIFEKQDLFEAIQESAQVVYVTHNYQKLVPSKLNLIRTTAQFVKQNPNVQRFIAVTPVELDNYFESDPQNEAIKSENDARSTYPNLTLIKSDVTVGNYSQFVHFVAGSLANNKMLQLNSSQESAYPINACDLADAVVTAIGQNETRGKSYLAQGPQEQKLADIIQTVEQLIGVKYKGGSSFLGLSPSQNNILSELTYPANTRNFSRFLTTYQTPKSDGFEKITSIKANVRGLDSLKSNKSITKERYLSQQEQDYLETAF